MYLGAHGAPESKAKYEQVVEEWLASNRQQRPPADGSSPNIAINELIVAFWDHATVYYVKNGEPTGEIQALRYSIKPLVELYGCSTVDQFGPRALKAVRQRMIDQGLVRTLINKRVNRIRHIFKWGVGNELVPSGILDALRAVSGLRKVIHGCDKAFPPPRGLTGEELKKWQKEHRWHPHQLRHNAATFLRKEYGIDAARIILGHRSASTTEVYAQLDHAKAIEIMREVG